MIGSVNVPGISAADFAAHTDNKNNPHKVNKTAVGLGNVPNVSTNDQTPTYTIAAALVDLVSGEKLSVSMGKIMKAIAVVRQHSSEKVSFPKNSQGNVVNGTKGQFMTSNGDGTVSWVTVNDAEGVYF